MWILLKIAVASSCPTIYCSQDPSHLCAFYGQDSITLASCIGNDWCDVKKLHTQDQSSLQCEKRTVSQEPRSSIYDLMERTCAEKDFVNILDQLTDQHPKICSTDEDCEMESGRTTKCLCGLSKSGNAYCSLGANDLENQYKYDAACTGDVDSFLYYLYYTDLFVYLQDRTECTDFVFKDVTIWSYLYAGGSISQVLANDPIEYSFGGVLACIYIYLLG